MELLILILLYNYLLVNAGVGFVEFGIVGILLIVVDNLDGILSYNLINNRVRQSVRQKCMNPCK